MTAFVELPAAIEEYVQPGCTVALEGFSHLVPFAAGTEIVRQGIDDLTVVRLVPDLIVDQMIGMGIVSTLVFSWAGNPGLGSLYRFRDAVENGWPRQLELVEHTHAQLANRFVAGAAHVPFAVMRGQQVDDLSTRSPYVSHTDCPFTGETVTAVRAVNPDVTVLHAQLADRRGNVLIDGVAGVGEDAVFAARATVVTVEQVVDELPASAGQTTLPGKLVDAVVACEGGSWPSYALGAGYPRSDDFYREWRGISKDRQRFLDWMAEHLGRPGRTEEQVGTR